MLEISQFTWLNYKESKNKFKLSSDEYIERAYSHLSSHSCDSKSSFEIDENKENADGIIYMDTLSPVTCMDTTLSPKLTCPIVLSPTNSQRKPKTQLNRRKKLQNTKSPLISRSYTTKKALNRPCQCVSSKLVQFQIELYKMLSEYSRHRNKMSQCVGSLIQSRTKVKDTANITTNADNLHLQTISSTNLICPEICDETGLKMDDSFLIKRLNDCADILECLSSSSASKQGFSAEEKTVKKQFYESVDLLAQLYGFFGILVDRIKVFNMKLELLSFELEHADHSMYSDFDTIYTQTLLCLLKAYLNANMYEEFESLVLDDKFRGARSSKQDEAAGKDKTPPLKISFQNIEMLSKRNKTIQAKPETLITFHLTLAHYLILKHQVNVL